MHAMSAQSSLLLLSIPGLRQQDLAHMPRLRACSSQHHLSRITPSFPCVTWPVQANLLTGCLPREHGIVSNGLYTRDDHRVMMWTMGNRAVGRPQVWDRLRAINPSITSAVWFPMLAKDCSADFVCMPAPIHNPDGSESLWCYTRPAELYGQLRDFLGHFPLQHFWGPLAGIAASKWILDSALEVLRQSRPDFFFVYVPHLDYAAQKHGPNSTEAIKALGELDDVLGPWLQQMQEASTPRALTWIIVSEYVIRDVQSVVYPNLQLREAGLLKIRDLEGCEELDFHESRAWCLVDHQYSHVYVGNRDQEVVRHVREIFDKDPRIAVVLSGDQLADSGINHERSGDVVLISANDSWQAYYWWLDDARAPTYARTVDIHRKPGYDPVELFWDPVSRGIPLNAGLVRGSHGAPVKTEQEAGALLVPSEWSLDRPSIRDIDVADLILRHRFR
jgi:hypothetical protein